MTTHESDPSDSGNGTTVVDRQPRGAVPAGHQPESEHAEDHKRGHRKLKIGAGVMAVAVLAGAAGGSYYLYEKWDERRQAVPFIEDENSLVHEQIRVTGKDCLGSVAGTVLLSQGVMTYKTPGISTAHKQRITDFVGEGRTKLIPYPIKINQNGHDFYEFSMSSTPLPPGTGVDAQERNIVYVDAKDSVHVKFQKAAGAKSDTECTQFDAAGNIVLPDQTVVGYPIDMEAASIPGAAQWQNLLGKVGVGQAAASS